MHRENSKFNKVLLWIKLNYIDLIFVLILCSILIIPNLKFNNQTINTNEKRLLAPKTSIIKDSKLNKNFPKEFENYYNDRFNGRKFCINAYHQIIRLFNLKKYENYKVIEGSNNWLFYKDRNFAAQYQNKILYTRNETLKIKKDLERFQNWCDKNNILLIVLIPPDKNQIYGEYFPKKYKKINSQSRTEILQEYLNQNSNINFIYPQKELLRQKKISKYPLYYATDSHWTFEGSRIAYLEIIKSIQNKLSQNIKPIKVEDINITIEADRNQDLVKLLNLDNYYSPLEYYYLNNSKNILEKYPEKIVMLGDSFGNFLAPWFKYNFEIKFYNYVPKINGHKGLKYWEEFLLKDNNKPDILILEFVERNSQNHLLKLYKETPNAI